jgi:predicted amidohydrolase YtcJ
MVTRTGWDGTTGAPNQRVTVDEAIRINTLNGAYAAARSVSKDQSPPASSRTL